MFALNLVVVILSPCPVICVLIMCTKMFLFCLFVWFFVDVHGVSQNTSCPEILNLQLNLKELDGKWFLSAVATDLQLVGDCAMVLFKHKSDNTTDISITWISNKTANYYNGTAEYLYENSTGSNNDLLAVTFSDKKEITYSILMADYEHYAVVYACNNTAGNSSTHELWQLSRQPHVKAEDAAKINEAMTKYSLDNTQLLTFNNTEECCKVNSGMYSFPTFYLMASTVAASFLTRIF